MIFTPLKTYNYISRDTIDYLHLILNNCPIVEVSSLRFLGFMFNFHTGLHADMIVSKTDGSWSTVPFISILELAGLSITYSYTYPYYVVE